MRLLLFVTIIFSLFSCSQISSPMREDPLLGKIYHFPSKTRISQERLVEEMLQADVIYLGEKHDNLTHHRIQLELLQTLIKKGKKPAIGFEFFHAGNAGYLMEHVHPTASFMSHRASQSPEQQLRERLGWGSRSDQDWQNYYQFLALAKENQLNVFTTDLPPGLVLRIARNGLEALTSVEKQHLFPTNFQGATYQKMMYQKFTDSHCGWGDPKVLKRLYQTWLARNDAMATAIIRMQEDQPEQPVVMIVGNGHVQHNMGIYERVAHLNPGLKQLNLGLIEITIQPTLLKKYFEPISIDNQEFAPLHEYVWFTQRVDYKDPCEAFRK